jgi:uncharacterized MnhB-related membrane protein
MSLRTILMIGVVVLALAWGVWFIVTGAPSLILAFATLGAGVALMLLTVTSAKKPTDGGKGE